VTAPGSAADSSQTDLTWIDLVWIDLAGRPRIARIPGPFDARAGDVPAPWIDSSAVVAGHSPARRGGRRLALSPDLPTARPDPFEPGVIVMLADLLETDGTPSPLCSRSALKRVLPSCAADGLHGRSR
jgi:glutamine synthetase